MGKKESGVTIINNYYGYIPHDEKHALSENIDPPRLEKPYSKYEEVKKDPKADKASNYDDIQEKIKRANARFENNRKI